MNDNVDRRREKGVNRQYRVKQKTESRDEFTVEAFVQKDWYISFCRGNKKLRDKIGRKRRIVKSYWTYKT